MEGITIAIITRDNIGKLKNCLSSILMQTELPQSVLIVDNSATQSAQQACVEFENKLTIQYVHEKEMGYSSARNCALRTCATEFLGFVDDDCILDTKWVEIGMKEMQLKKAVFLVGKVQALNGGNIYALTQQESFESWFYQGVNLETNEISGEKLDTKNVILRASVLRQRKICFDLVFNYCGAEDSDLGLQISEFEYKGYYSSKMCLRHEEPGNMRDFIAKAKKRGKAAAILYNKWTSKGRLDAWDKIKSLAIFFAPWYWIEEFKQLKMCDMGQKILVLFLLELYNFTFSKSFLSLKKE